MTDELIHLLYAFNFFTYASCLLIIPPFQTTHMHTKFIQSLKKKRQQKTPPLSRCKSCKRLIGTTNNRGCRGKNILVKYFSAFTKHLSPTLCSTAWQGSSSQRPTDICSPKTNAVSAVPAQRWECLGKEPTVIIPGEDVPLLAAFNTRLWG